MLSDSTDDPKRRLDGIIRSLESMGLIVHETEVSSGKIQTLGIELDCEELVTRVTRARRSRLRSAIRGLLRRRTASGEMIQIIVGHATFCGLVRRPSLSIFSAVYCFIAKYGKERAVLWETCKAELRAFAGLIPLLESSWRAPWSDTVYAFDSSLHGWGVVKSVRSRREIMGVCRVREKDRFKKEASTRAREHALTGDAAPVFDEHEGLWVGSAYAALSSGFKWLRDDSFPEVPRELYGGDWIEVAKGPWRREESITLLEARACLRCLQ